MPRKRRTPPAPPARPAYGQLLTQRQLDAFLAYVRAQGLSDEGCTLDGLQGYVEALQARAGFAATRSALARSGVAGCEYCEREGRASVAVEQVELDTGLRSVGAFATVCAACRPKALGLVPSA